MDELNKQIIEKYFDCKLNDDELIFNSRSPKSGISCWVSYKRNYYKSQAHAWKIINHEIKRHLGEESNFDDSKSIFNYMFSDIVISEEEDKAIKAMKRLKPHRDWNMFEIDYIKINNKQYTIVWD